MFGKLTGQSAADLTDWTALKVMLERFGASGDPRLTTIRKEGLNAVGFYSSSEALVAVPLLLVADQGTSANAIANKIGWWSAYPRTADTRTRALVGKLLTL